MQNVKERFDSYIWHDSKMLSFRCIRREEHEKIVEDLLFDIDLHVDATIGHGKWIKYTLVFKDCIVFKSDLYLFGKRYCSDDIDNASCEYHNELIEALYGDVPEIDKYFYFKLSFIEPGGEIEILAKDFSFE